jgi:hypothetical protein
LFFIKDDIKYGNEEVSRIKNPAKEVIGFVECELTH